MKLLLLTLFVSFFTQNLFAQQIELKSLKDIHQVFSEKYESAGKDNNYLESVLYQHANVVKVMKDIQEASLFYLSEDRKSSLIGKCLFMTKGAYGEHFSRIKSQLLTQDFLAKIVTMEQRLDLYLIKNLSLELINNDCGILIVDRTNNQSIILQGVSID